MADTKNDNTVSTTATPQPQVDLLGLLNSRRHISEKFGKKWVDNVKKWNKDYKIETILENKIEGLDNQMQIPYIFSTVESGLPSMFETMPDIVMKQRGKLDRDFTDFTAKVWNYVKDITDIEVKIEEAGINFLITGLAGAKYGWILETKEVNDTQQQPILLPDGSQAVHPETQEPLTQEVNNKVIMPIKDVPFIKILSFKELLFSPESKFTIDDEENLIPYIVIPSVRDKEVIEAEFGVTLTDEDLETLDLKEISSDLSADNEKDYVESDLKRAKQYEYYGILPKDMIPDTLQEAWSPTKVYYACFLSKKVIKQPEEIGKKPIVLQMNYGIPTEFFPFGEPKVIRELEQDVSLGRSRIADVRDKQGTKIALPQGTEVDENALKRSKDFVIMRFVGGQPPQYIVPPPISDSILVALQQSREDIQMASAQLDISRGGGSNTQIDTATGQKMFAEATDKRIGRKRQKLARFIKALAKNILILCAMNWDIEAFVNITDVSADEINQNQYIQKLQNLGREYDIEIDVESMNSNKQMMAAQSIALYREVKDDPLIVREEVLKFAMKAGFNVPDADRFIKTPDQIAKESQGQTPKSNVSISVKADAGTPQGDAILQKEGLLDQAASSSPDSVLSALEFLVQNQLMTEQEATQLAAGLSKVMSPQTPPAGGDVSQGQDQGGRPATGNPVDIVAKSMPGTDQTQIQAQNAAAPQQMGVPKQQNG